MTKRLSITLSAEDEAVLNRFRPPDGVEHADLSRWGAEHGFVLDESATEATLLRLLLRAGGHAVSARALEASYTQLAAGGCVESRAARERYAQRTDQFMPERPRRYAVRRFVSISVTGQSPGWSSAPMRETARSTRCSPPG